MLQKQSLDEFLSNINTGKAVIVSLSPQSRASIAAHFGISPLQVAFTHNFLYKCSNLGNKSPIFLFPLG